MWFLAPWRVRFFWFSLFSLSGNTENPKREFIILALFALHPDVPCDSAVFAMAVVFITEAIAVFFVDAGEVMFLSFRYFVIGRNNVEHQDIFIENTHLDLFATDEFNWFCDDNFAEGLRNLGARRDHHFVVLGYSLGIVYTVKFLGIPHFS